MQKFKTETAQVSFSLEDLKVQNLNIEKSKPVSCKSKSEMFRLMYDYGMEVCEIAKECNSHYSFVYGVISASREIRTVQKTSKSDDIRRLAAEGKTPGEISKLLNSNYSFVFSVVKKYKATLTTVTTEVAIKEA